MGSVAFKSQAIVYKATNLVNGHWYVGFTTCGLRTRERQHRHGRGNTSILRRAIDKYGQEAFVFEELHDFAGDEELAKLYEREMIAKHKPEYNLNYGGDGGTTHPDTRRKISEANKGRIPVFKGRKWTEEARLRMKEAKRGKPGPWAGKKRPEETVAKIAAALKGKSTWMKGRKHTEESRRKLSEAAKRRVGTATVKLRAAAAVNIRQAHEAIKRPVRCLNDGRVFASAREACVFYGLPKNAVSQQIAGQRRRKDGLRFEYTQGQT